MSKKTENTGFACQNCAAAVLPVTNGSYRNHCPYCLHSLHVDDTPGDRQSSCGALMPPVRLTRHGRKGPQIVHRCARCGAESVNRVASATVQPDDAGLPSRVAGSGATPGRPPAKRRVQDGPPVAASR